jgi:MoaA/NifB/PqqE/SkfB family radical SAM enzyme
MLLTLSPAIVLRSEPHYFNSLIAFNARTWETVHLSRAHYDVLRKLSNGALDESVVFDQLDKSAEPNGLSANDFIEKGLLVYTSGTLNRSSDRAVTDEPVAPGVQCLSVPSLVEACITRRCNEVCHHCNVSSRSEHAPEVQPISFWLELLDKCVEVGVFKITITGGEPFIRKDFDVLLEKLARSPIATSILTNGLCVSDHHIEVMKHANMSLGVSLDGAKAQEHDDFRRTPGAFNRTIEVTRKLGKAGVCFTMAVTIHSQNLHDLPKFIAIATDLGANTLVFGPMGGVGRGATKPAQKYCAPATEVWKALEEVIALAKQKKGGPEIVVANFEEHEVLEFQNGKIMSRRPPGLCKAGIFALAIDEDGTVYPCLRGLQSHLHPIGALTTQSMEDLWRSQSWSPFRNKKLPRVPCRVEAIEAAQQASKGILNVISC